MCLIPSYSPFLNPVYECFPKLKTHIRRKPGLNTDELREHVKGCTYEHSSNNCQGWIEHSIQHFEVCLEKKPIC
ncbi:MAG: hypothetical protein EXX96DRAFT_565050 [Benjaminiella poitrasii]|nr:MAG: hypothetical protein EXX96DRAFT_592223 [Benjaminiella poitrasii]KAI9481012.1 MAG: hypothetical protein EXX96DRAFT_565050 [Benjaminiella poitrasii]